MTYYLRKVIASRIQRGKTLYIMWGKEFKTLEEAIAQKKQFKYGDSFDVLRKMNVSGDFEVLISHEKKFSTGVYNKLEKLPVSGAES